MYLYLQETRAHKHTEPIHLKFHLMQKKIAYDNKKYMPSLLLSLVITLVLWNTNH